MNLILQLLLFTLLWPNPSSTQILSTIGLYENIVQTHENGNPMEVNFFDEFESLMVANKDLKLLT